MTSPRRWSRADDIMLALVQKGVGWRYDVVRASVRYHGGVQPPDYGWHLVDAELRCAAAYLGRSAAEAIDTVRRMTF